MRDYEECQVFMSLQKVDSKQFDINLERMNGMPFYACSIYLSFL